jgi:hypothetical protein
MLNYDCLVLGVLGSNHVPVTGYLDKFFHAFRHFLHTDSGIIP